MKLRDQGFSWTRAWDPQHPLNDQRLWGTRSGFGQKDAGWYLGRWMMLFILHPDEDIESCCPYGPTPRAVMLLIKQDDRYFNSLYLW